MESYCERLREGNDAQWDCGFSVHDICPNITTTEQPVILVCKEGSTYSEVLDLETDPVLYEPMEVEPLW